MAKHCPGKKLIDDDDANQGILDDLYDEVCDVGGKWRCIKNCVNV